MPDTKREPVKKPLPDEAGEKVAGLILGAGASTRMGKTKQLLATGRGPLIERVLREALGSGLDAVVLVLGHKADEIRTALASTISHPKLHVIQNPDYLKGMSTSLIAGLSRVEATHDHVMILLADMPHVTAGLINALCSRYLTSRLPLGALSVKGRRTLPVILNRRFYPHIHRLRGDVGARALFRRYPDRVCLVEPDLPYDDLDIDTPEDYARYMTPPTPHGKP